MHRSHRAVTAASLLLLLVVGFAATNRVPAHHLALFWPTGLGVIVLLGLKRRWWLLTQLALGLVLFAYVLAGGHGAATATGYAVGQSLGTLAATWTMPRQDGKPALADFDHLASLVTGSLTAGVLAALALLPMLSLQLPPQTAALHATVVCLVAVTSCLLFVPLVLHTPVVPRSAGWGQVVAQWLTFLSILFGLMLGLDRMPVLLVTLIPVIAWAAVTNTLGTAKVQLLIMASVVGIGTFKGLGPLAISERLGLPMDYLSALLMMLMLSAVLSILPSGLAVAMHAKQRDRAQREAERLRGIVHSANGVAIVGTDADGRIDLFNSMAERLFGVDARSVLGHRADRFWSTPEIARLAAGLRVPTSFVHVARALSSNPTRAVETEICRPDGTTRTGDIVVSPLRNSRGQLTGYVSTIEDVTERVAANEALQEALDAERRASEQLREIDQVKDIFVSSVSHELRTPITSMLGYLELLEDGGFGDLAPEQEAALGKVISNSNRLLTLIDDLLTLSRLEEQNPQELNNTELDLREIVNTATLVMGPGAEAMRLSLDCALPDEAILFVGDREQLERAVVNLISNAVKFSRAGGRVEVVLRRDGNSALIRVRDNGLGIPAGEQPRLFTRFFRSSVARDQAVQGSGLGLSITNALVSAYGGSIEFDSVEGIGTEFRVRLPLVVPEPGAAAEGASSTRNDP